MEYGTIASKGDITNDGDITSQGDLNPTPKFHGQRFGVNIFGITPYDSVITGLGFRPRYFNVKGYRGNGENPWSIGWSDGISNHQCNYIVNGSFMHYNSSYSFLLDRGATNQARGYVHAITDDGYSMRWEEVGSFGTGNSGSIATVMVYAIG